MLNRRQFIRYTLIGTGGATTGLIAAKIGYNFSHFEKAIIHILIIDLKGLKVKRDDINKYARELSLNNKLNFNFFTKKLISLNPVKFLRWMPLSLRQKYRQRRAEVVGNFLLSTNFFYNKMDEQLEIKYNGYIYEMYKYACTNPFSELQYQ